MPQLDTWLVLQENATISDVRAAFQEKLYDFADRVLTLIRPEDIQAMSESAVFTEDELADFERLYNELMLLVKDCDIVEVASTEAEEVALVQRICVAYPALVSQMQALITRTKEAYNSTRAKAGRVSYLG